MFGALQQVDMSSNDDKLPEIASLVDSSLLELLPEVGVERRAGENLCQRLRDGELSNTLNQTALRSLAKSLLTELSTESEGKGDAPEED